MNLSTIFIILVCLSQLLFTCSSVTKNTVGLARARSSLPKIEAYKERIQQKKFSVLVANTITASTDEPSLSSYSYTRILPVLPSELPVLCIIIHDVLDHLHIYNRARYKRCIDSDQLRCRSHCISEGLWCSPRCNCIYVWLCLPG